jgi:hypothetical protein
MSRFIDTVLFMIVFGAAMWALSVFALPAMEAEQQRQRDIAAKHGATGGEL